MKKPEVTHPQDAVIRSCLKCRDHFESTWPGERICKRCKSTAAWREG
ncbi:hypothetical protein HBA54_19330 [Pelagibius litoralis]|uniref:Uncharacterized protein n=1 Tax=Pelagibius litoralis TaxID=374515 RepID=A0A967KGZ8_9PROT|nr:hypothetical protein [Pelagibius litoralis]NIA70756.1 hypothetical protein [Pelagibius litoralis]